MSTVDVTRYRPDRETLVYWSAIVNAELLVLLLYFLFVTGPPSSLGFVLLVSYPFVWLNVSWWAYRNTEPATASTRRKLLAGGVAAGYFLLLAYVGGLLLPGIGDLATGLRVVTFQVPPGFAPAVLYSGQLIVVNIIPYQLVGYLTLAYLVYVTAIDVSGNLAAGVVGLFSCVSCTFPVIAAVVSGITGSATFAATITQQSYGLSTVVFVVTVLLLRWRPDMGDLAQLRTRWG
ncbi:DUF7546 family protein [Halorarius litoreus]|uniref:DUF7546 family protein n=1 Tax=Halorarius litoreus TaxID=2962676 RepID=UPI0020CD5DF7|nr:hypothetical protein [Halorarius litoreus]